MPFDVKMIADAAYKASSAVGAPDRKLADELARKFSPRLWKKITGRAPFRRWEGAFRIWVEQVLVTPAAPKSPRPGILYRERRAEIRQEKADTQQGRN